MTWVHIGRIEGTEYDKHARAHLFFAFFPWSRCRKYGVADFVAHGLFFERYIYFAYVQWHCQPSVSPGAFSLVFVLSLVMPQSPGRVWALRVWAAFAWGVLDSSSSSTASFCPPVAPFSLCSHRSPSLARRVDCLCNSSPFQTLFITSRHKLTGRHKQTNGDRTISTVRVQRTTSRAY